MSTNQVSAGKTMNVVTAGNVTSGAIYRSATICGVYTNSGVTGDVVPVAIEGVFAVLKDSMATQWTVGMALYANASLEATPTATAGIQLGHAMPEATTAATDVGMMAATGAVVGRIKLGTH